MYIYIPPFAFAVVFQKKNNNMKSAVPSVHFGVSVNAFLALSSFSHASSWSSLHLRCFFRFLLKGKPAAGRGGLWFGQAQGSGAAGGSR